VARLIDAYAAACCLLAVVVVLSVAVAVAICIKNPLKCFIS